MECVDFPRVLPNSPRKARGQIQVRVCSCNFIVFRLMKITLVKSYLQVTNTAKDKCVDRTVCCVSLPHYVSVVIAGHLWTHVFRKKVSFSFINTNTAVLCT